MKKSLFLIASLVVAVVAFIFVPRAEAETKVKLVPDTGYTFEDLTSMAPELQDMTCGSTGYPLCETIGHFGYLSLDSYGRARIPGLFQASDGLWYVIDSDTVFRLAGNNCYPYEIVSWPISGSCPVGSSNPLCKDYISRPGYVPNWYPDGKWPEGEVPQVSGYYVAGLPEEPLYCKIQAK